MRRTACLALALILLCVPAARAQDNAAPAKPADGSWNFAVSGDSRNCGNVVMPAIASSALKARAEFYWHLGDLRKIYDFDEDMLHEPEYRGRPLVIADYLNRAWPDFIEHQIKPFGTLPFFVGIGNHETIMPKTREMFLIQFADWLNMPVLQKQRLADDPRDHRLRAYYHWIEKGVDFIYLDNATPEQFDAEQMAWFEHVIARAATNAEIKSVVVGMHAALPDSISASHSMNESAAGAESGRRVYRALLKLRDTAHKNLYVLASHSHFYMDGIFNTKHWRESGGVLPGWIVGTAGAIRYALPENSKDAREAETNVYGYLLGSIFPSGEIKFEFKKLEEGDVPAGVATRFTPGFVHTCFAENSTTR